MRAGRRHRRQQRLQARAAWMLPEAARFSEDVELCDPVWLIEELKRHPQILAPLIVETTPDYVGGRRRTPGNWALLYIAFLLSGILEVKTFCERWASTEIYDVAGFDEPPDSSTVWLRFSELEQYQEAFQRAAVRLIQAARRHDDRIGRNQHVDGSAFTTNATLKHACPDAQACRAARAAANGTLRKATAEAVVTNRAEQSASPVQQSDDSSLERLDRADPRLASLSREERDSYQYFSQRGHIYRSRDLSAGARVYGSGGGGSGGGARTKKRAWFGGNCMLAMDDFTQTAIASLCIPASDQEYNRYPELYEKAEGAIGDAPEAMVVDRGFHVNAVFEHNTRRGVATIAPWRQPRAGIYRDDLECEEFDRDGVPRCQHCGGPTTQDEAGLGMYFARGEPRLRFRCLLGIAPGCAGTGSIACSRDWRMLLPVARTSKLYWDLRCAHDNKEGVFSTWRQRYRLAGNAFSERPKRRQSIPCMQLRAAAAILVDWFRLCLRNGWLGSHRLRNSKAPVERTNGDGALARRLNAREDSHLNAPYGPAALSLGLAGDDLTPAARAATQRAGP